MIALITKSIFMTLNFFIMLCSFRSIFSFISRHHIQRIHSHYKPGTSSRNILSTSSFFTSSSRNMFFSSFWKQIGRSPTGDDEEIILNEDQRLKGGDGSRGRNAVWTKETIINSVKESLGLLNPPMRGFLRIKDVVTTRAGIASESISDASLHKPKLSVADTLRILQLNMLADGLSGLRDDLGAFSRISKEDMEWDTRKKALLKEVLQYDPDIITLQECDHFYDWFLPLLTDQGYEGIFAPKPASACLEVSDNSDGCAIFVRRSKFLVKSVETLTYSLSKYDVSERAVPGASVALTPPPDTPAEDLLARPQNQVGLIVVCQLRNLTSEAAVASSVQSTLDLPDIIISTTHLKAAKSAKGERFRTREICQLLNNIDRLSTALARQDPHHREPIVILTGDLNASPCITKKDEKDYYPYAYEALKNHSLGLRSVLNDDEVEPHQRGELAMAMLTCSSTSGIRNSLPPIDPAASVRNIKTTFANEFRRGSKSKSSPVGEGSRVGSIVGSLVNNRADRNTATAVDINVATDALDDWEDLDLDAVDAIADPAKAPKQKEVNGKTNEGVDSEKLAQKEISSESTTRKMQADRGIWTTWKVRRKKGIEEASRMCIDYILYTPPTTGTSSDTKSTQNPPSVSIEKAPRTVSTPFSTSKLQQRFRPVGIRAKAVLDLLPADVVGPALLPSAIYPSDHLAIAADLEIVIIKDS